MEKKPIRIFISSPGDVVKERRVAEEVINKLADEFNKLYKIEAVSWDAPDSGTFFEATKPPQDSILKPSSCDIVLVILWSRLGTPLDPKYGTNKYGEPYTGTEWEYWDAYNKYKENGKTPILLVYRCTKVPMISLDDKESSEKKLQYDKIKRFFDAFNEKGYFEGIFNSYSTSKRFGTLLEKHLREIIEKLPRQGVGLKPENNLPDITWSIPITIGDETYHIARYPITTQQFKAFYDNGGYTNETWWAGFPKLKEIQLLKNKPALKDQQIDLPCTKISFFEALAFCRWLSAKLGGSSDLTEISQWKVRLPTVAEWQYAASGGQSNYLYPWGEKWLEGLANTREAQLNNPIAVGMYPTSLYPENTQHFDLLDMCGNVWEWCLPDGYAGKLDLTAPQKLLGGSWLSSAEEASIRFARGSYPYAQGKDYGFRLCTSITPSEK